MTTSPKGAVRRRSRLGGCSASTPGPSREQGTRVSGQHGYAPRKSRRRPTRRRSAAPAEGARMARTLAYEVTAWRGGKGRSADTGRFSPGAVVALADRQEVTWDERSRSLCWVLFAPVVHAKGTQSSVVQPAPSVRETVQVSEELRNEVLEARKSQTNRLRVVPELRDGKPIGMRLFAVHSEGRSPSWASRMAT